MDVVGSILKSAKEHSASVISNKELSSDYQKERCSIKCNICGDFFSRADLLPHNMSHFQENAGKKLESASKDNMSHFQRNAGKKLESSSNDDVSHSNKKPSHKCPICGKIYAERKAFVAHKKKHKRKKKLKGKSLSNEKRSYKCPVCGKIYTERKPFRTHKYNHNRKKKLKELGIHHFDKESRLKLKASVNNIKTLATSKAMGNIVNSEDTSVSGNIENFEAETESPVKLLINADVTANPMSCSSDSFRYFR